MKNKKIESVITPEIQKRFNEIGEQAEHIDPIVVVKLIDDWKNIEMYLIEYEPEAHMAFGYIRKIQDDEITHGWSIFNLNKVEMLRSLDGYTIESDPNFKECRLSECVKEIRFKIKMEKLRKQREDRENNRDQDKEQEL